MNRRDKGDDSFKNFGLKESEFNDLSTKMKGGDERLFEATFVAHFDLAMNYLTKMNGASRDDAYDIVMNVLIEFRKRILDNKVKYGNLKFMFTQMCVQRYKREKTKKLDAAEYARSLQFEDQGIDEEMYTLLDNAMNRLGDMCRQIIEDVYYSKIAYKRLEEKYTTSAANLRKQKERCMAKLKMNLRQHLNNLVQ